MTAALFITLCQGRQSSMGHFQYQKHHTRSHLTALSTPSRSPTGNLERGLVSCTGSQFCGFALIETKNRAMEVVKKLEAALDIPKTVRIHWTGCPNSCGQAQVRGAMHRGWVRCKGLEAA